jgi:formylglycine-generating enzyme required for sulfatase activity
VRPITRRRGRFHITDPKYASHPVLMVSGNGAEAFARRQGLRLPRRAELLRAGWGRRPPGAAAPSAESAHPGMGAMHSQMAEDPASGAEPGYWPVTHWPPNALGIRGLAAGLGEWVSLAEGGLAVAAGAPASGEPQTKPRPAWETFAWVGFRTAADLPAGQKAEP